MNKSDENSRYCSIHRIAEVTEEREASPTGRKMLTAAFILFPVQLLIFIVAVISGIVSPFLYLSSNEWRKWVLSRIMYRITKISLSALFFTGIILTHLEAKLTEISYSKNPNVKIVEEKRERRAFCYRVLQLVSGIAAVYFMQFFVENNVPLCVPEHPVICGFTPYIYFLSVGFAFFIPAFLFCCDTCDHPCKEEDYCLDC